MDVAQVIEDYRRSGRFITAGRVRSFVLDQGSGEAVVCLHGVPASAFLYRKVIAELAARGLRGIAFDLPGLGLAARPAVFDYTWTGLGRWATAAVHNLGLDRFHLVVHDIGAPVGFEVAAALPDRIASLTVLNAPVVVDAFRRPWVMEPFAHRGVGEAYLALLNPWLLRRLMAWQGIADRGRVTTAEIDAYLVLLRGDDRGRAFLQIMRGFELTQAKREQYEAVLRDGRYPVQVVWGEADPSLPLRTRGEQARIAADLATVVRVPGKHFFQEDHPAELADAIATFINAR